MSGELIVVTGGAGYIGSHTCVELLENGYQVIVIDNLCNSSVAIERIEEITGKKIKAFYGVDITNKEHLEKFLKHFLDKLRQ